MKKDLKRKKSVDKRPRKSVKIDELKWKPVEVPDTLDDYEGFYGLEEIDGVGVQVKDGKITFNQVEQDQQSPKKSQSKEEYVSPFPEEDLDAVPSDSESESEQPEHPKSTVSMEKQLMDVDFSKLDDVEQEEIEDTWGLGLSNPIRKALKSLGFDKPTEIQKEAIPELLLGNDVIGKAATGSGKTLAYGIPIIQKHLQLESEEAKKWPTGVIFGPTRELVHQIAGHLKALADHCAFSGSGVVPITGGLSIQKQTRLINKRPAIVVATPGRFLELLQSSNDLAANFKKSEMLVLDEADRLIQDGHFEEMEKVLTILGRGKRQTSVFSATFDREYMSKLTKKKRNNSHKDNIMKILKEKLEFRKEPVFIDANPQEAVASKVTETVIECGAMEKDLFLYYFCLTYPARTMVFVNSIDAVKRITPLLKELNLQAFALHSEMIQKQRLRSMERFEKEERAILIATDVAARGLDIKMVDHVVHYHVPRSADMYVHRAGRTARAGNEGISVVLCSPDEAAPLTKLQKVVQQKAKMGHLDVDYQMISQLRARVKIAKKISDGVSAGSKTNDWLKQAAEDLGADLDDLEDDYDKRKSKQSLSKDELRSLRAQLKQLLSKPVGRRSRYITSGAQNMAHLLVSGESHEQFLGKSKKTALQSLRK